MRIIRRTLAILAAALVVIGITFGFAQSSNAQSLSRPRPARSAAAQGRPAGEFSGAPGRGFEHEGNRSPSLFGAIEIVKDLAVVGIIVALVTLMTRARRRRRPVGRARRDGAEQTAT